MEKKIFDPQAKIKANVDRVVEFIETGNTSPILIEVDPSNACNHACSFCLSSYIHFDKYKGTETFSTFAPGQGKGFPNATPQTSVGSTNAFARRAIARRAVTSVVNNGVKKNCACVPQPVKNLKGQFHN